MTEADKIAYVKCLIGDSEEATDEVITAYLLKAKMAILNRRYTTMPDNPIFPKRYDIVQCELAERYFNRRGAEGEISHNENGINRSYKSVNDDDLLSVIVPVIQVK